MLYDEDLITRTHEKLIPLSELFDCLSQLPLMTGLSFLYGLLQRRIVKITGLSGWGSLIEQCAFALPNGRRKFVDQFVPLVA